MSKSDAKSLVLFAILFAAMTIVLARPFNEDQRENSDTSNDDYPKVRPKRNTFTLSCAKTPQKFVYMDVDHNCFDENGQTWCDKLGLYQDDRRKLLCYKCCKVQATTVPGKLEATQKFNL